MIKNYKKVFLGYFVFLNIFFSNSLFGQCGLGPNYGQYLGASNGTAFITLTNVSPGTFFNLSVLNGGSYGISMCASGMDTELSFYNPSNIAVAYNDGNGPFCAGIGPASIDNYVPNFSDYLKVQLSQWPCQLGGSSSQNVQIRQNNNLAFTSSSAAMCSGQTRVLTATPAPVGSSQPGAGNLGSFSGTGVAGNVFTAPVVGVPTNFTVTYTFGFVSQTQVITVNPRPTITASASSPTVCFGSATTLSGGGASTYTWTGGPVNGVPYVPGPVGNYTFNVSGTSAAGCISTNTPAATVTVVALPFISASAAPSVVCLGKTTSLFGFGLTTYTWTGGVTNGVAFTPAATTNYTVTGTLASNGCTNSAVQQVSVNTLPPVNSIASNPTICLGQSTTLNGTGATTYTWSSGVTNGLAFSPAATAQYTVTGTLASTGCSNTAVRGITVNPLPVIGSSASNNTVCNGSTVSLAGTGAVTYTWTGGITNATPFNIYATTSYSVNGTDAAGCTSTNTPVETINVLALPSITTTVNNPAFCFGGSCTLTGSGANTYTWTGGIFNAVGFTPAAPGNFTYACTGTDGAGCTSTNTAVETVTVNGLPIVGISSSTTSVCLGNSVTLSGTGAVTYTWTGGITDGVAFAPLTTTTYSVNGTNATGCTSTNTAIQTIITNTIPLVSGSATSTLFCLGFSTTFNGSGANTYAWTGGVTDGVPFTPGSSGNSSYSLTGTSIQGCSNTVPAVVSISVHALPTVNVVASSTAICFGSTSSLTASGANTYTWNPGNILASSANLSPIATTIYTITGTDALTSCENFTTITIVVNPLPVVTATASNPVICDGFSSTLTAGGALTYTWNVGTPGLASATVAPSATTNYSVVGTSVDGCLSSNVAVVNVSVNALPVVSSSISVPVICFGGTTSVNGSGADSYVWTGGITDGLAFTPAVTTSYSVAGTSTLTGCTSTNSSAQTVLVNQLPVVAITTPSAAVCDGFNATLIASTTGTVAATVYSWNPGNITGTVVVFSPTTTSQYSLVGQSAAGCTSTNSAVQTITVYPIPTVGVTSSTATICFGVTTTLTGTGALTYTLSPAASGTFVGNAVTVSPITNQTFSVSGTSTAGCVSTSQATTAITVVSPPNVGSTVSGSFICQGGSTTLNGTGADTYTWSGGVTNGVAFNPPVSNTYTVTGTNTLTGCTSTNLAVQSITVNAIPTVSASATNTNVCAGFAGTLLASGAGTYTWNPGNLIGASVTINPLVTTTYTLVGTSTANCTSTNVAVQTMSANPIPTVAASTSSAVICAGATTTLNAGGAGSYTWNPGNIVGQSVTVNPTTNTTYSLVGLSLAGCTSTNNAVQTITVNALPAVTANASNTLVCFGFSTTLFGSGANTYTWSGGVVNNITFSPSASASYTVTGTDLNLCENTATIAISVNPIPTVSASASGTVICFGNTVTLSGSGASTYTWTGGVADGQVFNPTVTDTYSVTGTSTAGCVSTNIASITVVVNSLPNVTGSASTSNFCIGNSTSLQGFGALNYTWSNGVPDGVSFSPTATAVYTVTGVDANTCENTATVEVVVNQLPILSIVSNNTLICEGETASISVSGANTYTWSNAQTGSVIFVTPTLATTYSVDATDINGCKNTASFVQGVQVCPGITNFTVEGTNITCLGRNDGKINVLSSISYSNYTVDYFWTPSGICPNNNCFLVDNLPVGTYSVRVLITYTLGNNVLVKTTAIDTLPSIEILDVNGSCEITVYNAITANNDGINDKFSVNNIMYYPNNKVSIYNRWGIKVSEISNYNNLDKAWPTEDDATKLVAGTYYYIIDLGDGTPVRKGWIELVKN